MGTRGFMKSQGFTLRVYRHQALVIGAGAAGFSALCRLQEAGLDCGLFAEGLRMGTSRNTGSDKQTYYRVNDAQGDSALDMARTLFSGGAMHGDVALAEAGMSARCFYRLVELGVAFPHDAYGRYIGYQTDHDTHRRATSLGPLTSKAMTEALEARARALGAALYDHRQLVALLCDGDAIVGALALDTSRLGGGAGGGFAGSGNGAAKASGAVDADDGDAGANDADAGCSDEAARANDEVAGDSGGAIEANDIAAKACGGVDDTDEEAAGADDEIAGADDGIAGAVEGTLKANEEDRAALDTEYRDTANGGAAFAFDLFLAPAIVYATGGPAGLYETSVYPASQTGALGVALEAGAAAQNLTESQFGLASTGFRWNLSGSYQQVLPDYVSVDEAGEAHDFLADAFESLEDRLLAIFQKGYQWPFDARKAFASSRIDLAVEQERRLGRRVYLDYRVNPGGDAFALEALPEEAREYLRRSDAMAATPIERLRRMNAPAIELYRAQGIDLWTERLPIAVCAQHMNGGLGVDGCWRSNIAGLYPVGEASGTHGVYRPGGAALNAGQVGALRAAMDIVGAARPVPEAEDARRAVAMALDRIRRVLGRDVPMGAGGVTTGDGRAATGAGGALTGNGVVATGDGRAASGDGGAAMGNGVVATGDGRAASGDGGALTGAGGAAPSNNGAMTGNDGATGHEGEAGHESRPAIRPAPMLARLRKRSAAIGFVRSREDAAAALRENEADRATVENGHLDAGALPGYLHVRDHLLAQGAVLSAIIDAFDHGVRSRGSVLVHDDAGELPQGCPEAFRFALDDGNHRAYVQETRWNGMGFSHAWVKVRPLPQPEDWFEAMWAEFRRDKGEAAGEAAERAAGEAAVETAERATVEATEGAAGEVAGEANPG